MKYDLVFEGGGAKGMVFVGAMQVFEQRGHSYQRLLGTSAGAITAALLAAGYSAAEMLDALGEKENERSVFSSFMGQPGPFAKAQVLKSATLQFLQDVNLPLVPDFLERRLDEAVVQWLSTDPRLACSFSFLEYGGLYTADAFLAWMKKRLDSGEHRGKPRQYSAMTLAEFYAATATELTLVASDTTGEAMLVLNHRTAPRLPLVWAVRMSMSIPLLWQEVTWQPEWGEYRARPMAGHAIVDGGMLSNFPIELFVSQDDYVKNLMGPLAGEGVLGMLIDEAQPVPGAQALAAPTAAPTTLQSLSRAPVLQRVARLMNTALSAHDKLVSENFEHLVVRLPAHGFGTTEFDMTDERRELLVQAGCTAMEAYFEKQEQEIGDVSFDLNAGGTDITPQADRVALKMLQH